MKSPAEIRVMLRRQWENAARREARLLGGKEAWPVLVSIGRPSAKKLNADLDAVKRHIAAWRRVRVGKVMWKAVRYRATSDPVEIPAHWCLQMPSEWLEACSDAAMRQEFDALASFVEHTDSTFHALLVRKRSLWRGKPIAEVVQAARLALTLEPNCAQGRPLRMLSNQGIDTKFFERNAQLVTALLDERFDGEVSRIGLENFLGALVEGDHWLLLVDLDGSLLPFQKTRVRSSELRDATLPGTRLLLVENESCQHQLPVLSQTIAVLGSGFDLAWLEGDGPSGKQVAYWGDIDTWGLQLLARARKAVRHLHPILMAAEVYEQFADLAVAEPVVAGTEPPTDLSQAEQRLYRQLLREPRGRLEQEFLPEELCRTILQNWACDC
ncbi:MAG TPA: DUF3322 domain-containing protein [Pirellulales bacterium]|nr:DUF3322 domain-containing protein [Pirellulales bacterium]